MANLETIGRARDGVAEHERGMEDVRIGRAALVDNRNQLLEAGQVARAESMTQKIEAADAELASLRHGRDDLLGQISDLSDGLLTLFTPESLTATLDGT